MQETSDRTATAANAEMTWRPVDMDDETSHANEMAAIWREWRKTHMPTTPAEKAAVSFAFAMAEMERGMAYLREQLAAAQADTARLDWWEAQRTHTLAPVMDAEGWRLHEANELRPLAVRFRRTLRAAIDAARAQAAGAGRGEARAEAIGYRPHQRRGFARPEDGPLHAIEAALSTGDRFTACGLLLGDDRGWRRARTGTDVTCPKCLARLATPAAPAPEAGRDPMALGADEPPCAECGEKAAAHPWIPEHQGHACPSSPVLALTFYRAPARPAPAPDDAAALVDGVAYLVPVALPETWRPHGTCVCGAAIQAPGRSCNACSGAALADALGFSVEQRGDVYVVRWDNGGTRPAASVEAALWDALAAARAREGDIVLAADLADARCRRAEERAEQAKRERDEARAREAARPKDEWSEDDGSVLWWTWPVTEEPYVGTPLDSGFPSSVTHWTPLAIPTRTTEAQ